MLENKHIILLILTISIALLIAFFALTAMTNHSVVQPAINASPVNSSENTTDVAIKKDIPKVEDNATDDLSDEEDSLDDSYDDTDYEEDVDDYTDTSDDYDYEEDVDDYTDIEDEYYTDYEYEDY